MSPAVRKLSLFGAGALTLACALWLGRSIRHEAPRRALAAEPSAPAPELPPRQERLGGLDVTFLVAADTHVGFAASEHGADGGLRDPVKEPAESDRHEQWSFGVVRVTDTRLSFASWHFGERRREFWHDKPINGQCWDEKTGGTRGDRGLYLGR